MSQAGRWFAAKPRQLWPEDPETVAWIEEHWDERVGDCRQEIVMIGVQLNRAAIEAGLDTALLTDTEMAAGPEAWQTYADELPTWEV